MTKETKTTVLYALNNLKFSTLHVVHKSELKILLKKMILFSIQTKANNNNY